MTPYRPGLTEELQSRCAIRQTAGKVGASRVRRALFSQTCVMGLVVACAVLGPGPSVAAPAPPHPFFFLAGAGVAPVPPGEGRTATDVEVDASDADERSDGTTFVADFANARVEAIDPTGRLHFVAGTGRIGSDGDGGPATRAHLMPNAVSVTRDGELLVAESSVDSRIRLVRADGTITTVAGTAKDGFSGDGGPARAARLQDPADVLALSDGSFLIAERFGSRVRRVDAGGRISTILGTGRPASTGDEGPAVAASTKGPASLAVTPDGALIVGETYGARVRRIGPDGIVTTIAGGGHAQVADGHPATRVDIRWVSGVAALPNGDVAFAGAGGLWRVAPDGTLRSLLSGRFHDFAGRGLFYKDTPGKLALTPTGELLVAGGPLRILASPTLSRFATSITGMTSSSHSVSASALLSSAASATLTVRRRGLAVARSAAQTAVAGLVALRIDRRFAPGRYTVHVRAQTPDGRVASDSIAVVLGARLVRNDVKELLEQSLPESNESAAWYSRRCHRFGPRRIDCEIWVDSFSSTPPACESVVAVTLPVSGIPHAAVYRCPRSPDTAAFRRHPSLVQLSRPLLPASLEGL
jgi:hypothetical protein